MHNGKYFVAKGSELLDYRIYSNKCRIWDKKVNKGLAPDALTADIFALVIMKLVSPGEFL